MLSTVGAGTPPPSHLRLRLRPPRFCRSSDLARVVRLWGNECLIFAPASRRGVCPAAMSQRTASAMALASPIARPLLSGQGPAGPNRVPMSIPSPRSASAPAAASSRSRKLRWNRESHTTTLPSSHLTSASPTSRKLGSLPTWVVYSPCVRLASAPMGHPPGVYQRLPFVAYAAFPVNNHHRHFDDAVVPVLAGGLHVNHRRMFVRPEHRVRCGMSRRPGRIEQCLRIHRRPSRLLCGLGRVSAPSHL